MINPVVPLGGLIVALLLVTPFVLWKLVSRLRAIRRFKQVNVWVVAGIDFILLPLAAYGVGAFITEVFAILDKPGPQQMASRGTQLLIYMAVAIGSGRLIEVWFLSRDEFGETMRLSQLTRNTLFGVCCFIALLVFLISNDYAPTELYISTGAFAALIAFAMQQTLGDLFSGISLSLERPFKIGDWLRFGDGTEGEVTDINWRATRLRGWDNTTYVVPNAQLAKQSFTNLHGANHLFAPWYYVRISGDADPAEVKPMLEAAARRCGSVLPHPAPVARLTDGSTIPFTYMVWVHFADYPTMFVGREELYREIRAALLDAGLELATDIQEVRLRGAPHPAPE